MPLGSSYQTRSFTSLSSRLIASAFSASDNGNVAIIANAARATGMEIRFENVGPDIGVAIAAASLVFGGVIALVVLFGVLG